MTSLRQGSHALNHRGRSDAEHWQSTRVTNYCSAIIQVSSVRSGQVQAALFGQCKSACGHPAHRLSTSGESAQEQARHAYRLNENPVAVSTLGEAHWKSRKTYTVLPNSDIRRASRNNKISPFYFELWTFKLILIGSKHKFHEKSKKIFFIESYRLMRKN